MHFVRVRPPNHNYRPGFYGFRWEGTLVAVGLRLPLTTLDIRLWFHSANASGQPRLAQEKP
jgi:hypothetical protein